MTVRVGDRGKATTIMTPSGGIVIHGKQYSARSQRGCVEKGQEVIVVGGDNGGLIVIPVEEGVANDGLPKNGQVVYPSFLEKVRARSAQWKAAKRQWLAKRRVHARRMGATLGFIFSVAGLLLVAKSHASDLGFWELVVGSIGILLCGVIWGTSLFVFVDRTLQMLDESFHRITFPTTCSALLGSTLGAAWGIPACGLIVGLMIAVLATFLLLVPFPVFALIALRPGQEPGIGNVSDGRPADSMTGGTVADQDAADPL
jgi:hypothetical protein